MRICFLSTKHPPFDKRVFAKEAVSLARAGHRVTHLAPASGVGESLDRRRAVREGVEVLTFPPATTLLGRLSRVPRIYRLARAIGADCYHCNEVDSWLIGLVLKLRTRSKLVFDVHEPYATQFPHDHCPRWLRRPVAWLIRATFRLLGRFTDRLVLVSPALEADFPGARTRSVVVRNFASLAARPPEPAGRAADAGDRAFTAIHVGLFHRARGWPQLLEAMHGTARGDLRLHIVGSFGDGSREAFLRRSAELGLAGRILIEDWMPYTELFRRLLAADAGLVLFQPGTLSHTMAMPHKLFDYMLAGLPVIVPACSVDIAALVRESECGIVVNSESQREIGDALNRLASDSAERRRLGGRGRQAVAERYNWESESRKLVGMYRELEA